MCDYTRIKVGDTLKFSEYYIKCFYNIPEEIKRVRCVRLRAITDYESPECVIGCMVMESAGMFIMYEGGPIPGMGPGIPDPDGAGYTNASFVCT